ncbi:MAG: hypothetical protein CSA42_05810 [Gammaproteobacteria bacterium]|nr:MAG: hypothetical protein CSA42_05810 [Gammaproteobacteria bacterium]
MIFIYVYVGIMLIVSNWLHKRLPNFSVSIKHPNHAGFVVLVIYSSFYLIQQELARTTFFIGHIERYSFLILILYLITIIVNLLFSETISSKKQLIIPIVIPILTYILSTMTVRLLAVILVYIIQ